MSFPISAIGKLERELSVGKLTEGGCTHFIINVQKLPTHFHFKCSSTKRIFPGGSRAERLAFSKNSKTDGVRNVRRLP